MITIQNYVQAESLEEAYTLNQRKNTRILGGMIWMKMEDTAVGTAVDLCRLGLDTIEETEDQFIIGAMTTLRQGRTQKDSAKKECGKGDLIWETLLLRK